MKRFVFAGIAALGFAFALPAAAQGYPSKPIKMIVPLAAAGTGDTLARTVGEEMSKELGQPVPTQGSIAQPQLRGAQGEGRAHPPHEPGDGCCGRGGRLHR